MKATHTTIYTADDGTEYTDARLCAAHEQVLAKGEHAYGTIEFEEARDALAAPCRFRQATPLNPLRWPTNGAN